MDAAPRVRIVIADRHPISRDGLRRLVETDPDLEVVAATSDLPRTETIIDDAGADLLLLELPGDGQEALEVLQRLAARTPAIRTVILTDAINSAAVVQAVALGVRGVIVKDSAAETLFKGIHSVIAGARWIDDAPVEDAVSALRSSTTSRQRRKTFGLTKTEVEIVRMVVEGHTNKEIGERLSIAENTVKSHLAHIFTKLGASNRVELALFAAHHRLLDAV
jgi:DNA-binding NarL/FixJ family response regulator